MADDPIAAGVVENLVTQFSSALDCVRELVQNSIDAGTDRVEVWTCFVAGEGHVGAVELHVDDYGEGMDESIIDNQLTRLFASSKENDLTKIGKFGIGFVSVFALEPRAVLLHTGRAGEYWEVLFHEDRSFTKTRIDSPVEGTQITIFLEGDRHLYRETVSGVFATLKRWCAHAETEITFEDRSPPPGMDPDAQLVNEPFEVAGDCFTRVEHQGTEIVLAYSCSPMYGFYNRGLTLAQTEVAEQVFSEKRARRYTRVAVKVKSRYLEHTLSRETVMRDESYEKAMALLDAARNGPLVEGLLGDLEALVALPAWGFGEMDRYATLTGYLLYEPDENLEAAGARKILRGAHGEAFSLEQVDEGFGHDERIFFAEQPTALTRRVFEQGTPVLLGAPPAKAGASEERIFERAHPLSSVAALPARYVTMRREGTVLRRARRFLGLEPGRAITVAVADPEDVYLPVALDERMPEAEAALVARAERLLGAVDAGYKRLRTFAPDLQAEDPPLFVVGRKLSTLMARPPAGRAPRKGACEAAVNRRDPHFLSLLGTAGRSPELAAYCLARCLLLDEDRFLDRDLAMMMAALPRGR